MTANSCGASSAFRLDTTRWPSPSLPPRYSPTIAPITANTMPTSAPAKM